MQETINRRGFLKIGATLEHKWGQATFMELDNKSFTCK